MTNDVNSLGVAGVAGKLTLEQHVFKLVAHVWQRVGRQLPQNLLDLVQLNLLLLEVQQRLAGVRLGQLHDTVRRRQSEHRHGYRRSLRFFFFFLWAV